MIFEVYDQINTIPDSKFSLFSTLLQYIAPEASLGLGGGDGFFSIMFNDGRVYGTALLFIMVTVVYIGVKYVNYSANVSYSLNKIKS